MKKLLLITNDFPYGESEYSFLATEFEELRKNFQIHILAGQDVGNCVIYPMPQDVQVGHYQIDRKWERVFRLPAQFFRKEVREDIKTVLKKTGNPAKKISRLIQILAYSECAAELESQFEKIVQEEKVDLIYTYWCTPATLVALRLKKKHAHLKVLTRFHGCDLFEERTSTNRQCMREYIAEKCDRLVFVSQQGRRYFLGRWGGQWQDKSVVSYLGCRKMHFLEIGNSNALKIISCSNLIPLKRVERIIAALAELPESLSVEWNHFGDGTSRESCEENAEKLLGCRANIRYKFWGTVPNEKLEDIYEEIVPDIFITASSTEGLPISVMEASAMGIPTIGTDVGGMSEIIEDGKTGFLLSQNPSPAEITAAIIKYGALSVEQKMKMRDAAYARWTQTFDAQKNAVKFCEMLGNM